MPWFNWWTTLFNSRFIFYQFSFTSFRRLKKVSIRHYVMSWWQKRVFWYFCSPVCRLTGSFVPDLIVSMSHQMWLHLQSDESVGSIGFKINYKGRHSFVLISSLMSVFMSLSLFHSTHPFSCLHFCPICLSLTLSPSENTSLTRLSHSSPGPL